MFVGPTIFKLSVMRIAYQPLCFGGEVERDFVIIFG
jgi:hypothetical protein